MGQLTGAQVDQLRAFLPEPGDPVVGRILLAGDAVEVVRQLVALGLLDRRPQARKMPARYQITAAGLAALRSAGSG